MKIITVYPGIRVEIKQLDKRFVGFPAFKYMIHFLPGFVSTREQLVLTFHQYRDWCVETFGMSCERDDALHLWGINKKIETLTDKWCWETDNKVYKIYLKGIEELNWYKLRWE